MTEENRELQVEFKAQPGIIESDFFPRLTAWIDEVTAPYRDAVVTEGNLKQSEADLAVCRKTYTTLETERKNLKKLWNAPYDAWEKQYKEAVSGLVDTIGHIDTQVKVFKEAEKNARYVEVSEAILSDVRDILGKEYEAYFHLHPLWSRVFREEYVNKTYSRNKAQLEWRQAITQIAGDFKAIGDDEDLLVAYWDTGSLAEASMKVKADRERMERLNAKPVAEELEVPPAPADVIVKEVPDESNVSEELRKVAAATRRYTGPKYKLYILFELADALGLTYEKTTK